MNPIHIHKNGQTIQSVVDWFRLAPPKEGIRQWKDGRSAKELANAWFPQSGDPLVPSDLIALLNSDPDFKDTIITEGIPEHKIPLDTFKGETRNADLVLVGYKGDKKISINIEAKADESFDEPIGKKLRSVTNPRSRFPERVDHLSKSLFGHTLKSYPELMGLRYQLLTGCAGALIEATRVGADIAIFVVHVFVSDALNPKKVQCNDNDYRLFLKCLAGDRIGTVSDGQLFGPIKLPGGPFVPSGVLLYVGKIKTELR